MGGTCNTSCMMKMQKFVTRASSVWGLVLVAGLVILLNSCVMDIIADNLGGDGGSASAFTAEDDPELVAGAMPTFIKLYDTILSMTPKHVGMNKTTGSMFIMYANAFVAGPADYLDIQRADEKIRAGQRAAQLYIRGRNLVVQSLDLKYPGFREALLNGTKKDFQPILNKMVKKDVPALYWLAAGWFGAASLDTMNVAITSRLTNALECLDRACLLDPDYDKGTLDELYIQVAASMPSGLVLLGNDGQPVLDKDKNPQSDTRVGRAAAERHYQRAVKLSSGTSAGLFIAWAGAILEKEQKKDEYVAAMKQALAIDLDKDPNRRLVNVLNQRRAAWCLKNIGDFFPISDEEQ